MSTYGFQSVTRFIGKQKQNQYSGFESLSKTCIYFINLKNFFFLAQRQPRDFDLFSPTLLEFHHLTRSTYKLELASLDF